MPELRILIDETSRRDGLTFWVNKEYFETHFVNRFFYIHPCREITSWCLETLTTGWFFLPGTTDCIAGRRIYDVLPSTFTFANDTDMIAFIMCWL